MSTDIRLTLAEGDLDRFAVEIERLEQGIRRLTGSILAAAIALASAAVLFAINLIGGV